MESAIKGKGDTSAVKLLQNIGLSKRGINLSEVSAEAAITALITDAKHRIHLASLELNKLSSDTSMMAQRLLIEVSDGLHSLDTLIRYMDIELKSSNHDTPKVAKPNTFFACKPMGHTRDTVDNEVPKHSHDIAGVEGITKTTTLVNQPDIDAITRTLDYYVTQFKRYRAKYGDLDSHD